MATSYQIRMAVADMYDAPAWKAKVSHMPDNQVYAIFRNNMKRCSDGKPWKRSPVVSPIPEPYKQLTLWDLEVNDDQSN